MRPILPAPGNVNNPGQYKVSSPSAFLYQVGHILVEVVPVDKVFDVKVHAVAPVVAWI